MTTTDVFPSVPRADVQPDTGATPQTPPPVIGKIEPERRQRVEPSCSSAATRHIERVLRREHRIRPGEASDFNIRNQATLLNTFEETTRTFSVLLAGIAIVLFVA